MRRRYLCIICVAVTVFLFLALRIGAFRQASMPEMSFEDGDQVLVKGTVERKEEADGKQILYVGNGTIQDQPVPGERILIRLESKKAPAIGQQVLVSGTIRFFQEPHNPGNFNQKFYYQKQRIYASIGFAKVRRTGGEPDRWKEFLYYLRRKLTKRILSESPQEEGQILCALLLGEKSLPSEELKTLYQKSGIGHLLAVSGLHISFLGLGIYHLLRKMGIPIPVSAVLGIVFLGGYLEMIGLTVSALRSAVMFLLRMGAEVSGRVYDGLTALAAAVLVSYIWQPLYLFDTGFWLSAGAILGIYGVVPELKNAFAAPEKGADALLAGLGIQLVTLPVLLWAYYEYALYSLLWNLLVLLLAPVVMGAGIAGILAGPAGRFLFAAAGLVLKGYETGSRLLLELPFARIVTGKPGAWQMAWFYLCIGIALFFCRKEKQKKGQKRKIMLFLLIGIGVLFLPTPRENRVELVMLDVGQGDGIFLRGPKGRTYLIDGGSSSVREVGTYRILPFLESEGISELDYVLISHGDLDHYSGVEELLQSQNVGVRIRSLVIPEAEFADEALLDLAETARKYQTKVLVIHAGEMLSEGKMSLKCIWPESGTQIETGNQTSMVLSLQYERFSALFTGDLEGEGEEKVAQLLREKADLPDRYTVLKTGHHGSKNATGEALLVEVNPAYALVSAGERNRYGHPHEEVLKRLEKHSCKIYNTKEQRAICIFTDGERVKINLPMQKKGNIVY